MPLPDLLRRLLTAPGPSGYETAASAVWREAASSFAGVSGDALGSSVARVDGTGGGPTLAVLGHIDEIGLMVTHVDESGFLSFLTVGGWRAEVLLGQRVELLTRDGPVQGVVGRKWRRPPKRGEEIPRLELDELYLDIGIRGVPKRWSVDELESYVQALLERVRRPRKAGRVRTSQARRKTKSAALRKRPAMG